MQGCVKCDCETSDHHEEISHCQVEQNVVQRGPQLFVFDSNVEGEEVDGEGGDDEEQHVCSKKRVLPGLSQVVLRVLEWTEDHPSLVRHGDIKVGSFCAIHGFCWWCIFFLWDPEPSLWIKYGGDVLLCSWCANQGERILWRQDLLCDPWGAAAPFNWPVGLKTCLELSVSREGIKTLSQRLPHYHTYTHTQLKHYRKKCQK